MEGLWNYSWGQNTGGMNGCVSTQSSVMTPSPLKDYKDKRIVHLASSSSSTIMIDEENNMRVYRSGSSTTHKLTEEFISIKAGYSHVVYLRSDNVAFMDTNCDFASRREITQVKDIVEIATGISITYLLQRDGTVWKGSTSTEGFARIGENATHIYAGLYSYHCFFTTSEGLFGVGSTQGGRMGIGNLTDNVNTPTMVPNFAPERVISITCGYEGTIMLAWTEDMKRKSVYFAGAGNYGGVPGMSNVTTFREYPEYVNFRDILQAEVGCFHYIVLGIDESGVPVVYTHGNNAYGQSSSGGQSTSETSPTKMTTIKLIYVLRNPGKMRRSLLNWATMPPKVGKNLK